MAVEKTEFIGVRVTPEGLKAIKQKAEKAGISPSRYVREVALGELPQDGANFSKYDRVEALQGLKKELNMMGNNLNQIARIANQSGQVNDERVTAIRKELHRLKMEILKSL
jgi:hypothetical protein